MYNDKLFKRSKYNDKDINAKRIYPKGWFPAFINIEMNLVMLAVYYHKMANNYIAVFIYMTLFYIVALVEFILRFTIKNRYFKNGYSMGAYTAYYHKVIKLLLVVNIGLAVISLVYICVHDLSYISENYIYDNYWIWLVLISFLACFEPYNEVTSGFCDSFFLSDRYVVDYSQITEIRIVKEKITTKGTVCEIELYKGQLKVGKDRVFEEDFVRLKEITGNLIK